MNAAQLRKKHGSGPFTGNKAEVGDFVTSLPTSLNTTAGPNGPAAFCLFIHLAGGEPVETAQAACGTGVDLKTAFSLLVNATIASDPDLPKLLAEKLAGELTVPVKFGETTIKPQPAKKKKPPKPPAPKVPSPPPAPGSNPPPLAAKSQSTSVAKVVAIVGLSLAALGAGYFAWRTFRRAGG